MPVNIHGKEYRTVAERVNLLHREYERDVSVTTEIISIDDQKVIIKATIATSASDVTSVWTGHALEVFGSSMINKTSALENAETSAIGRALASAGFGGEEFASADEVANAITQQNTPAANSASSNGSPTTSKPVDNSPKPVPESFQFASMGEWGDEQRSSYIPFGKHKGIAWRDIPEDYLSWLVNNSDNQNWKNMASAEISARMDDDAKDDAVLEHSAVDDNDDLPF